jgi:hypothetical protein
VADLIIDASKISLKSLLQHLETLLLRQLSLLIKTTQLIIAHAVKGPKDGLRGGARIARTRGILQVLHYHSFAEVVQHRDVLFVDVRVQDSRQDRFVVRHELLGVFRSTLG